MTCSSPFNAVRFLTSLVQSPAQTASKWFCRHCNCQEKLFFAHQFKKKKTKAWHLVASRIRLRIRCWLRDNVLSLPGLQIACTILFFTPHNLADGEPVPPLNLLNSKKKNIEKIKKICTIHAWASYIVKGPLAWQWTSGSHAAHPVR